MPDATPPRPTDSSQAPVARPRRRRKSVVTRRSIALGLVGVVLVCAITPYNDYALNNTFFVGNNLPLAVVLMTFLFVLLVNAPLHRFAPRFAFSGAEVSIALGMTLVSCCLPSSGLMRYFPSSLVMPWFHARSNYDFAKLLSSLNLPDWLFPTMNESSVTGRSNDPVVWGFAYRWIDAGLAPYAAWVVPAVAWGVFLFALYGALLCMVTIVRRQWHENERLQFPLAQIHLALVEQPAPGRSFNSVLSSRSFWMTFLAVFLLHAWNGLNLYDSRHFPRIPVYYNLTALFTEPPFSFVDFKLKDAAVFFTVVGVTYFLATPVAFSLWFFFILHQVYRMVLGTYTGDGTVYGQAEQHFGGLIAFVLAFLWVGRKHWKLVIAQAFRGERVTEPRGRYLPYPVAFWGLVGCAAIMTGWLVAAGASVLGSVVLVLLLLTLFLAITRIVAEAGLVHGQLQVPLTKPWQLMSLYGVGQPVSNETFYLGATLNSVHYDFREPLPVYASHGLKVTDQTTFKPAGSDDDSSADRRTGRQIIATLVLALFVGYIVSLGSSLWTEYTYAWTQDISQTLPINKWGASDNSYWLILDSTSRYTDGNYPTSHSPIGHLSFGFVLVTVLSYLRLTFTWWPLHPIGYLMLGTFPGGHLWFSIFIGWMLKIIVLRLGGSRGFTAAKPAFLGLIVGESIAAAFWLLMGVLLSQLGVPFQPVNIMPG